MSAAELQGHVYMWGVCAHVHAQVTTSGSKGGSPGEELSEFSMGKWSERVLTFTQGRRTCLISLPPNFLTHTLSPTQSLTCTHREKGIHIRTHRQTLGLKGGSTSLERTLPHCKSTLTCQKNAKNPTAKNKSKKEPFATAHFQATECPISWPRLPCHPRCS